ncbi:MAG: hypothetical protein GF384_06745 [Elusimicrobia bacterium]|nr:hypothetical protein [Elusimicrobiota bacterium]
MAWVEDNGWYHDTRIQGNQGIIQFTTGRSLGDQKDPLVRRAVLEQQQISGIAFGEQVHGNRITVIDRRLSGEHWFKQTDGFVTQCPGMCLGIFTADCVPVWCVIPGRRLVGIAHAGWRGIAKGIIVNMVQAMSCLNGNSTEHMMVSIGPHIRSCCYSAGNECARAFSVSPRERFSLEDEIIAQCIRMGITESNVSRAPWCTAHDHTYFYSYRKENGTEARMLSVIGCQ